MKKENLIFQLKALKPQILRVYKAEIRGIFGSWARNEQTNESDLDILVHFNADATLLDLSGLQVFLEDELKISIDVVSEKGIKKEIMPFIYKDLQPL